MKSSPLVALALAPLCSAYQFPEESVLAPDAWSPRVGLRTPGGGHAAPVHATLLPDGRVVFIGYERPERSVAYVGPTEPISFTLAPTPAGSPPPAEVLVTEHAPPLDFAGTPSGPYVVSDDLFCGGNTLTADGELFTAGGTRGVIDVRANDFFAMGMNYATRFDGVTWERLPGDMVGEADLEQPVRWYPACTRLPDERILVTGGYDLVIPFGLPNLSVEAWDPATGAFALLSAHADSPAELFNSDYTHPFVLPSTIGSYEVVMFGQAGVPILFGPAAAQPWSVRPAARPGTAPGGAPNYGASTAMLPIRVADGEWGYSNGSVFLRGGNHMTSHLTNADVYDPVLDAWHPRIAASGPRHHPATVLLPDGRVLVVAGHAMNGDPKTARAELVTPWQGFEISLGLASSRTTRGYHTVALLLPDGRVLVAGGRGNLTAAELEKTHLQYYSPPYMSRPRPAILSAPPAITAGGEFVVTASEAALELVLVGLGSMTHSMDFNQRHVQVPIVEQTTRAGSSVVLAAAPDARRAPPGYYMLFVLDGDRTPSEARIVRLQ